MIIAVPRVGSLHYMARDFCERTGLGFVEPPPYTKRTIERGVAISPEHFCFPMKVLLGSAMESLEAGADTLITVAGYGACRFNYFAELQKRILERHGYEFQMVAFDSPRDSVPDFYRNLRAVARGAGLSISRIVRELALVLRKGQAFDAITKRSVGMRALEVEAGAVDVAVSDCEDVLSVAFSRDEIDRALQEIDERFGAVRLEPERPHIKVGVIGEIMISMEPYFNIDIDKWLARRGAVVDRTIFMSDIMTPFGRNPVRGWSDEEMAGFAAPYLCHEIGGHGQLNVAAASDYARKGFDAVVHLFPFTCLPEVIARTIFVRMSGELDLPILSLSVDEMTGRAGMETRLEALVDLAWARQGLAASKSVSRPRKQSAPLGSGPAGAA
ncbi:MAG TPA: hypothetical protein VIK02_01130 [Candidatus Anoxymicrobiaceae bacterium]